MSSPNSPLEIPVPQMNPNDEHAVLVRWHVESGHPIRSGQALATLETTKATFEVESPRDGYVHFDIAPKTLVPVGARLAWICDDGTPPPDAPAAQESDHGGTSAARDPRFTRKALQLMRQHKLEAKDFAAMEGRIEAAQVEELARERATRAPDPTESQDHEPLEQSPAKMIEIQSLAEVYRQAVPSLVALSLSGDRIERRLQAVGRENGPVSLLELVIHEAGALLMEFPDLNGYYLDGKAWHYRTVSVGFAINLGKSLLVPVVHRTSELSLRDIAREVRDLSLRYMRGDLQLESLTGGTFTVTDLSGQGVEYFVPVLNRRQAAILGLCAERPDSGRRDLILTFDHRMSDGMRAASFLAALRDRLECVSGD
jgi:pyruvate/2-oxoglutarate dehydrogenase complex dihydrolipoamide acyltransferase (E2) component